MGKKNRTCKIEGAVVIEALTGGSQMGRNVVVTGIRATVQYVERPSGYGQSEEVLTANEGGNTHIPAFSSCSGLLSYCIATAA